MHRQLGHLIQSDQTYYVSVHYQNRRIGRAEMRYVEKVSYIGSEDK